MENKFRKVSEMNVCFVYCEHIAGEANIVLTNDGGASSNGCCYFVGVPVIYQQSNGSRIVTLITLTNEQGQSVSYSNRIISSGLNIAITKKDANLLKKHNLLHLVNRYVIIDEVTSAVAVVSTIRKIAKESMATQRFLKVINANLEMITTLKFSWESQRFIEKQEYHKNKWCGDLPLGSLQALIPNVREVNLDDITDDIKESDGWWAGVELETLYDYEDFLTLSKKTITKQLNHRLCYRCERDGSLGEQGYEFISPAYLHGKGLVKFISHFTNEKQNDPDGKCGMHLHYSSLWLYNNKQHTTIFLAILQQLLKNINVLDFFGRNYCDYATKLNRIEQLARYSCVIDCDNGHFEFRIGKSTSSIEANTQIVLNMLSLLRRAEKNAKKIIEECRTNTLIKLK